MSPVIEDGSEVWAAGTNTDVVNTFQVKYLKRVCKIKTTDTNISRVK